MKVDGGIGGDLREARAPPPRCSRSRATTACGRRRRRTTRSSRCSSRREHTERVELGTGIAVAFARNPMNLASIAYDLQACSKGRFILGLGSQIKPHIEKRFSMPWSHPAARMRELILAIRAIWAVVERRHQARLPRRLLHAHPDDAVLQPRAQPARQRQDVPRRRRRADDRGRRRGVRRLPRPRLHHRALPPRGHAPRARARRSPRRAARWPTSRSPGPASSSPARNEEEMAKASTAGVEQQIAFYGSTPAYRAGARAPRLGRPPGRAQRACRSRASGRRWASSSTTTSSTPSRSSPSPRSIAPELTEALRRHRRPPQLLRALHAATPSAGAAVHATDLKAVICDSRARSACTMRLGARRSR